jgi:hypothetical protein
VSLVCRLASSHGADLARQCVAGLRRLCGHLGLFRGVSCASTTPGLRVLPDKPDWRIGGESNGANDLIAPPDQLIVPYGVFTAASLLRVVNLIRYE